MILTWGLVGLSAIGLGHSIYGCWLFYQLGRGCASGCPLVMGTRYARLLGFPNTYIAVAFFAGLIVWAAIRPAVPLWPVLAATGLSLLCSAYLAWVLLLKLRQT